MSWWHWLLIALPILPNLWSIWHVRAHEFPSHQEKSLWFLLAVFVPVVGGIVYFAVGRRRACLSPRDEQTGTPRACS